MADAEPQVQTAGSAAGGVYDAALSETPAGGVCDVGEPLPPLAAPAEAPPQPLEVTDGPVQAPAAPQTPPAAPLASDGGEAPGGAAPAPRAPPETTNGEVNAPSPKKVVVKDARDEAREVPVAPRSGSAESAIASLPPAEDEPPASVLGVSPQLKYADPDEEAASKGILLKLSEAAAEKNARRSSLRGARGRCSTHAGEGGFAQPVRRRRQLSPVRCTSPKVMSRKMEAFANGRTPPLLRRYVVTQQTRNVRLTDDELYWMRKQRRGFNMNSGVYTLPKPQGAPPVEQCIEQYRSAHTDLVDVESPAPEVVQALTVSHQQGDETGLGNMTIHELVEHARVRAKVLPKLRKVSGAPAGPDAAPQYNSVKQAGRILSMTSGMQRRETAHIVPPRTIGRIPLARITHREGVEFSLPPSEW